ncbi:hypothetical protein DDZ13_15245 [Coraliomargarita sinensis]|uniref:PEGA domain-containing protein n=1 Tax=Coraliomargarita sinensis TaxID=2174842 RepID=A0A317ZCE3_9BACT|nr:hypothetical protein [Coraliomargarita sinensis]PXA02805.1 hypothetical protein DDZ13_15245 [Coraliomargarita sinensis]
MNKILVILVLVFTLSYVGCRHFMTKDKGEDIVVDAVLVIDPKGGFDSAEPIKAEVYLEGRYLGETPIIFTPKRRAQLGLPDYEVIELDGKRHWVTWDLGGPGLIEISHPESMESKMILEIKKPLVYKEDTRFTGMYGSEIETGMGLWVRLQKNNQ